MPWNSNQPITTFYSQETCEAQEASIPIYKALSDTACVLKATYVPYTSHLQKQSTDSQMAAEWVKFPDSISKACVTAEKLAGMAYTRKG